jgi:hypothetical protein
VVRRDVPTRQQRDEEDVQRGRLATLRPAREVDRGPHAPGEPRCDRQGDGVEGGGWGVTETTAGKLRWLVVLVEI